MLGKREPHIFSQMVVGFMVSICGTIRKYSPKKTIPSYHNGQISTLTIGWDAPTHDASGTLSYGCLNLMMMMMMMMMGILGEGSHPPTYRMHDHKFVLGRPSTTRCCRGGSRNRGLVGLGGKKEPFNKNPTTSPLSIDEEWRDCFWYVFDVDETIFEPTNMFT